MPVERRQGFQAVDAGNSEGISSYLDCMSNKNKFDEIVAPVLLRSTFGSVVGGMLGAPGGPVASAGGAVLGSSLGIISGTIRNGIVHYQAYEAWVAEQEDYKTSEVYNELSNHETLQQYLCPLSFQFFTRPVRTPYGHVFNYKSITHPTLVDEDGMISDPYRNPSYSVDELIELPELLTEIQTAFVRVLNSEIESDQISASVRVGLEAFVQGLEQHIDERRRFIEDQLANQAPLQEESKSFWQFLQFWK